MQGYQLNPKIIGAIVVGFSLVAGAYTVNNFGEHHQIPQPTSVQATTPTERIAIEVTDNDENGIEDWRDEFVTTKPIIIDQASSTYILPDTLTGKMSINLMEEILHSRMYGGVIGKKDEEIIQNTVESLVHETEQKLYSSSDITIMSEWDDEDIKNYANTVAAVLYNNSIPNMDGELVILKDYIDTQDENKLNELKLIAGVYQSYIDDTLKIPVPAFLAKEHTDLINTYEAIRTDIEGMTLINDDPIVSLLRIRRYQDDADGLFYALQNMYLALEPHASLFTAEDPAALFTVFSPNYKN